ncbi:MAG: hypothetical protein [Caudoviricetes sp.]|nr:MAG: hypothetical protein [Caudoviricetes sp.]
MKLIDLIVKHVPREKIPSDAKFFAQDPDDYHETWSFSNKPCKDAHGEWFAGEGTFGYLDNFPVAEDASTTVITRDELMRAYDMAEVHFDTVAQRGRNLCIFQVGGSPDISIDVSQDSEVSVENEWLTVRHDGQLIGMFRMENIAAWLIKAVEK